MPDALSGHPQAILYPDRVFSSESPQGAFTGFGLTDRFPGAKRHG
jgi:hypothetical protein